MKKKKKDRQKCSLTTIFFTFVLEKTAEMVCSCKCRPMNIKSVIDLSVLCGGFHLMATELAVLIWKNKPVIFTCIVETVIFTF